MSENKRLRDKNGQFAKKNLYLTESCRKCPIEDCEGVFAIKGSVILRCPKKLKYKENKIGKNKNK